MTQELSSVQTALAIRSKKLSSVRSARAVRSKQLSVALLFQIPFVCDAPVKKCTYNSSKRCLPSPHEFSWYIFCWIAFFAFITFDYRYKFYPRLSYNIQQISRTSYVWPFRMKISNDFGSRGNTLYSCQKLNFACCYGADLKNINGSLHLHGGLNVKQKLVWEKASQKFCPIRTCHLKKRNFKTKTDERVTSRLAMGF